MPFNSNDLRKEYPGTDLWMPDDSTDIVAHDNIPQNLIEALRRNSGELKLIRSREEMQQHLDNPNLRLILGRSELKLGNEMERAKGLAMVAKCCIGTDGLDFAMAASKGIVIINSRQAANSVAELALELSLGVTRNTFGSIMETCVKVPDGKLRKRAEGRHELSSMTVGILGAGQIGSLTAEKMRPLVKDVFMFDDAPNANEKIGSRGKMLTSLDELLERSDIVIVHADDADHDGKPNIDLITAERLRGKNVFALISLARDQIVTVAETVKAIELGYIQRARTDVYPPKLEAAKQWECPIPKEMVEDGRFIGTAHIGASTEQVQKNIGKDVYEKWLAFTNHRDISPGLNFSARNFIEPEMPRSIVFQHSIQPGTIGILGDALGAAGISAGESTTKDINGTLAKGKKEPLNWGMTRFDTFASIDERQIGHMLEELKRKNGGFKLHRVAVIDREK